METIVISTILVNICIGCFACVGLTTAISMIQSIINDHKREKREQEKDKRDLEYHEMRMKEFKQSTAVGGGQLGPGKVDLTFRGEEEQRSE